MRCKACGGKTNKEITRISLVFSISTPESVEIEVENNYKQLSIAWCIANQKQLHELLDKTLCKIQTELFAEQTKKW